MHIKKCWILDLTSKQNQPGLIPSVYLYFYGCPEARKVFRARFDTGFKTGELFLVAVQFFPDTNFWTYTKTDTVFVTQIFEPIPKRIPFSWPNFFKRYRNCYRLPWPDILRAVLIDTYTNTVSWPKFFNCYQTNTVFVTQVFQQIPKPMPFGVTQKQWYQFW